MLRRLASTSMFVLCVVFPTASWASVITIDFEGLLDSDLVTTQFAGVSFTNATVLTAGISLNEFEFPPSSGVNVVFDQGGPIQIVFATPVSSFSAFFTYAAPLTLTAFNGSNVEVASVSSAFMSNLALSGEFGSAPNELLQLSFAGGISSITIEGDPAGGSFVMDDLNAIQIDDSSVVPEPTSFVLALTGLSGLIVRRRIRRAGSAPQALP